MKLKSIRWRLSISYAAITLLSALLLGAILLGLLFQYYTEQETNYLMMNAESLSAMVTQSKISESYPEVFQEFLKGFSFISNAQVRIRSTSGEILVDSGPPQDATTLSFEALPVGEPSVYVSGFSIVDDPRLFTEYIPAPAHDENTIYIQVTDSGLYPGYVMRSPVFDVSVDATPLESTTYRSNQSVQVPYYGQDEALLGYIELSNGPAYGREILNRVAWGWAIAALLAVLLAAAVGVWVSRRFSAPIESLTQTTTQMAEGNLSARSRIERQDEFGLLANSFNQMAESIETKVAALQRFVTDAAHELHTPLTALRINLELIDDKHVPRALEKIERMDDLTRSLLDLSKIEALASEVQFEDIDLALLLREFIEPISSRAEQAELGSDLDIVGDSFEVRGDKAQLRTLIQNLLDNAIKFTPAGGEVHVELVEQDDVVQLAVTDNGIGIPEDDLPHLFSRFHRGRNASAYPGSGLGLAIVKTIVDQHQAAIDVKSQTNETSFIIRFPVSQKNFEETK
jgi:signal transduction histidine kinase